MAEYVINSETLEDIADAIRDKTGETEGIKPKDMADKISGIKTADLSNAEIFIANFYVVGDIQIVKGTIDPLAEYIYAV